MESATIHATLPGPAPVPSRTEAVSLLEQVLRCSREEKRYILERLLHDYFGEHPPKETGIYNDNGQPYVYILEPEHRIRLFVTPERIALWASQDPSPCPDAEKVKEMMRQGDVEGVKAWLASRKP